MGKKDDSKKVLKDVAEKLLGDGKSLRIPAEGYSMFPSIRPGNIILIDPVDDPDKLKPGDIIAWTRDSDIVVHRLIMIAERKGQKRFVTCGDSSLGSDKPVSTARIVGKVEYTEVAGKTVKLRSDIPGDKMRRLNRIRAKTIMIIRLKIIRL